MKDELARRALGFLRKSGFVGRGSNVRVTGNGLQWVVQVERVSHVDQVNIEVGVALRTTPPANRSQCRILWSLADFPGVESDGVARALHAVADFELDDRIQIMEQALRAVAEFVDSHPSAILIGDAYRMGLLAKAFIFKDARDILEAQ